MLTVVKVISPETRAKMVAARLAATHNTCRTTRPGSETTDLVIGDRVAVGRLVRRFGGNVGTVVGINRQTFHDGGTYVEIGVNFGAVKMEHLAKAAADAWFRDDELEVLPSVSVVTESSR